LADTIAGSAAAARYALNDTPVLKAIVGEA
jgi:hypothetical protein